MTDDITQHDAEDRSDENDHQQAREACERALDALYTGDLSRALTLFDEVIEATQRAQSDSAAQERRETAYDCYD